MLCLIGSEGTQPQDQGLWQSIFTEVSSERVTVLTAALKSFKVSKSDYRLQQLLKTISTFGPEPSLDQLRSAKTVIVPGGYVEPLLDPPLELTDQCWILLGASASIVGSQTFVPDRNKPLVPKFVVRSGLGWLQEMILPFYDLVSIEIRQQIMYQAEPLSSMIGVESHTGLMVKDSNARVIGSGNVSVNGKVYPVGEMLRVGVSA